MAANDTPTLADRVQGLPAELFNDILDLVLTPDNPHPVVDINYKPPVQLQIDRRSRAKLAATYYKTVTFKLVKRRDKMLRQFKNTNIPWLQLLSKDHQKCIEQIQLQRNLKRRHEYDCNTLDASDPVECLVEYLADSGVELDIRTISCNFRQRVLPDLRFTPAWCTYSADPFTGAHRIES